MCLYWPRFYYSIFKWKQNRQTIWEIITRPVPPGGTKERRPSNIIVCLNQKSFYFYFYQTQGAYAHLDQRSEKNLDKAVTAETVAVFYDDPLHLATPYIFFMERLPEPLDGLLKSMLSFILILFVYLYPILRGLISLWTKRILKIFVNHGRRRQKRHKHFPKIHIKVFAADKWEGDSAFYWETDCINFIVGNSATEIICRERKLFTGHLYPMSTTLETAEGMSVSTKLVGVLRLLLTYDINKKHIYDIPGCVYDPESPLNILGVPCLGKYFDDGTDIRNPPDED